MVVTCTVSVLVGGEIPESLQDLQGKFANGADKATGTIDKFKSESFNPEIRKLPVKGPAATVKNAFNLNKAWKLCSAACDAKNKLLFE